MSLKTRARDTQQDFLDAPIASDPQRRSSGVQARAQRHESVPPALIAASAPALIAIDAPADAALLEPTYAYLSVYCSRVFSPGVADRVNVAIYELYANALRYGNGDVRLEIRRDGGAALLRIESSADPASIARLRAQVARVHEDAQAAFNGEMSYFGSGGERTPMLGIVRVAHESQLQLQLEIDGARVTVSTRCDE